MKKIFLFICIGIISFTISCKKESGENDINPLALLAFVGSSTLTVHATYNGDEAVEVDATKRIYVFLYDQVPTNTRDVEARYTGSTETAVTVGAEATITINNIIDGDYYVLIFYDYDFGDNYLANQYDRYELYNNVELPGDATTLTISGDTDLPGIVFGNEYLLANGGNY